uniref:CSON006750 protein n=1 Tax=Culicoides sonorensis TaxID=179676 RepID=A0A336KE58_CULSO
MWELIKNENLKLGKDVKLEYKILKYLTETQVNGLRFLYKNFLKGTGCILCGPRRHFFNEWIIFSLIYALAQFHLNECPETSSKDTKWKKSNRKICLILTKTKGKKLVWKQFFQKFLPDVLCKTITKDTGNFVINCTTFSEIRELQSQLGTEKPFLIIFDESNDLVNGELDSKQIKSIIASKVPVIFSSDSENPVLNDLQHFHKLLLICRRELCYEDPFHFINDFCKRENRSKLRDFIRPFYLEHYWREVKCETFPFETRELNEILFNEKFIESQSQDSDIYECDTVKYNPLPNKPKSSKTELVEDFTCNMPPLHLDGKSETETDIYEADTQPFSQSQNNENKSKSGTPQSIYAQEINYDNVEQNQVIEQKTEKSPDHKTEKMNITEDLFKDPEPEVEEIQSTPEVIVVSSGSTTGPNSKSKIVNQERCTSPDDLFSDDDDTSMIVPFQKMPDSPEQSSFPVIKALGRCNATISTPIAQLINGKAFHDSESPISFLSPHFWSDTKKPPAVTPKNKTEDSVFEITKNDVFGNVLRVNENNEISPVGQKKDTNKFDWSALTNDVSPKRKKVVTPSTSLVVEPDSPSNKSSDRPSTSSNLNTPTSKRLSTPSSSRSSSKRIFKSGGGWLNKYSPHVAPTTPKTPRTNRRKKLETLFNDVETPGPQSDFAQSDLLMSPNDLFE